jgi:hypothetical protein
MFEDVCLTLFLALRRTYNVRSVRPSAQKAGAGLTAFLFLGRNMSAPKKVFDVCSVGKRLGISFNAAGRSFRRQIMGLLLGNGIGAAAVRAEIFLPTKDLTAGKVPVRRRYFLGASGTGF